MTVNDRVKQVRKMFKLNQTEFGKKLGVSRAVIVNIELDKVEPKSIFLDHLCEIFGISKHWLLTGDGVMKETDVKTKKNLTELIEIYNSLSPIYQDYLLNQIKDLLKLQDADQHF